MKNIKNNNHYREISSKIDTWKGEFRLIGNNSTVDWIIILVVTCTIVIALVVVGIFTYNDLGERVLENTINNVSSNNKAVDTVKLTSVLRKFDARKMESDQLRNAYNGPGDPSL